MRVAKPSAAVVLLALAAAGPAHGDGLSRVETEDLRLLYFDPGQTYLVPRVIQTFHDSLERQQSVLGYEPTEKTTILLTDFTDYGNAGANAVPSNLVTVDVAPRPFTFETLQPAERMYTFMNHEMVHVATLDHTAPYDRRYRHLFRGKVRAVSEHPETIFYQHLTAPWYSAPRWYLEGIAVFIETWLAGGLGRVQGAFDEMVFRAKVRDSAHFYDPLGLVAEGIAVDFQVGANAYLYGTRFLTYIAYEYTPEKLIEWVSRDERSKRSYHREFERVFGKPLNEAWQDWIEFEHRFQQENLEQIRRFPTTGKSYLTDRGLGSVSRAYYDRQRDTLIGGFRYPGVVAHIGELSLENGEIEHLEDIKVPMLYRVSSVAYDPDTATVFYTADNYAYRDLMAVDVETGKARMLLHDARIGDLVFDRGDRSLWGVRHLNGYASLVRIPPPYDTWELVHTLPYGEVVYDLDISPDGTLLSGSFGALDGSQSLKIFEREALAAGEFEPVDGFDFGLAVPEGFVFSPDSRFLFGSSYYTGVSNIFRYELETGELEAVSNAETGLFRPIPLENGELIVFEYTGEGFRPARIRAEPLEDVSAVTFLGTELIRKYPRLAEWRAGTGDPVPAESRIVDRGEYVAVKNLSLESAYPVVLGFKDSASLGLKFNFSDPVQLDRLGFAASYSIDDDLPSDERLNLSLDYRHAVVSNSPLAGTWRFGARHNYANFYDLFGPTKESRKGNRFYVGYDKTLVYDEPRRLGFSVEVNHYNDIDALPRYQEVAATIDQLSSIGVGLDYSHVRSSLGAVDDEKGVTWEIEAYADHVEGDTIPRLRGEFDFGFALPIPNSSIWVRNAAGAAFGEPEDEFANFFFGGFGNNYVDNGIVKRYRQYYALPGFDLNAVPGRNFHRAMLEWNLPPIRFSRVGTPEFYLSWARPALFVSALTTNLDDGDLRQEAQSAGLQLDFQFTVQSRLPMTLSLGYAAGFLDGDRVDTEFMVSLKIL